MANPMKGTCLQVSLLSAQWMAWQQLSMCLMLRLHTSKLISMPNAWHPPFQGRSLAVSTEKVLHAGGQSNQAELRRL